jgi:hypothetical protein
MKKLVALCFFITACSPLAEDPYKNYPEMHKAASARCDKLGYVPGSPDFYACVGEQYTRIKSGQ